MAILHQLNIDMTGIRGDELTNYVAMRYKALRGEMPKVEIFGTEAGYKISDDVYDPTDFSFVAEEATAYIAQHNNCIQSILATDSEQKKSL